MRLTQSHVDYWKARTQRLPSWAQQIERPRDIPSVHYLINMQFCPQVRDALGRLDAHNALSLLRSKMRRGMTAREALKELAGKPGVYTGSAGTRREFVCRRWLERLQRGDFT